MNVSRPAKPVRRVFRAQTRGVRALFAAVLTLAVAVSVAPAASAGTAGTFRPVKQPTSGMIAALFREAVPTQADVFNGKYVKRGEHPYVGLVMLIDPETGDVEGQCSGSLIKPRFVVTAGHCTKGAEGALFIPKVTNLNDARPRDVFTASAIATAPRYSRRTLRDDVGLLKLSRPVTTITPVTVAGAADDGRYAGGTTATIVGWGAVDRRLKLPMRLRRGTIKLLSNDRCAARWGALFKARSMICGGSRITDTCVGDSGGPLLVRDEHRKWLLLGTTSFGRAACNPALDSVYARVSSVRPWIEQTTGLR